ncbi:hypothetical protein CXK93_21005 [Stutzerimonas decontaminans]|jgi:hypothetical protein|uniref:Curlin associated repeat-containing protein n=2 Tax=Stutzerimonas TaxID=2901164 RepID=A0ABX4VSU0_9GAMM|nr:hypothetical protein [Stutzerimonas decontaminans]AHY43021.1 hypothetical protein UIB01_11270 [Stutzerimonas decontaminans]MCQ4244028.1 hypothetical protein [Stutzerimonas decontaminans]PNF83127.1 hypothetical protein CXK93_21005 [Stutzerimonas decontaminans]
MFAHKPLIACILLGSLPGLALAQAITSQTGSDNQIILEQTGPNSATQLQEGTLNWSRVVQDGDNNLALTDQRGYDLQAQITQTGSQNQANVYQANLDFSSDAQVEQLGTVNLVELVQQDGNGNNAILHQLGAGNVQQINQTFYINSLEARSEGNDNLIEVVQNGGGSAQLSQLGDGNRLDILQESPAYGSSTRVTQIGDINQAAVSQVGGRYYTGEVRLVQRGASNRAEVTQWAGFSTVEYTQEGIGNELNAQQGTRSGIISGSSVGNDNRVNISQDYDGPVLDIAQNGSANEIDVVQDAAYGTASISQTGDANVAVLNQVTTFDVQPPNTSIVQNGTGNSTSISQR